MQQATSLKLTPASLTDLWREIAVYLEVWDLLRQAASEGIWLPLMPAEGVTLKFRRAE